MTAQYRRSPVCRFLPKTCSISSVQLYCSTIKIVVLALGMLRGSVHWLCAEAVELMQAPHDSPEQPTLL